MVDGARGYFFMVLLAVQFGMQPLLTRRFLGRGVIVSSSVLAVEVMKVILSLFLMVAEGQHREALAGWTLRGSLRAAGLPAISYAAQNLLLWAAMLDLDALVFNLVNQTKVLFTALCVFALLGRRQSPLQVLALVLLFVAALICSGSFSSFYGGGNGGAEATGASDGLVLHGLGFWCAVSASGLSGLGAALSERALQAEKRNSYLFSAELAVFSSLSLLITFVFSADGREIMQRGFFSGWELPSAALPLVMQSVGGIFVGQVTKHAGSVAKGFAIMAGIILTMLARFVVEGKKLDGELIVALPLVLISVYLHSCHPPACKLTGAGEGEIGGKRAFKKAL